MSKRTITLAILAVAAIGMAISGCKNGDKADDSKGADNGAETSGG